MTQVTTVALVDDVECAELADGTGETIAFALDGQNHEIDLSADNAAALRAGMFAWMTAGRPLSKSGAPMRRTTTINTAEVRDWARSNGYTVPDRGRIPQTIKDAFDSKTPA